MKLKFTLIPIGLAAGIAAFTALHPGVAVAEPRIASTEPTSFSAPATYSIDLNHASINFEIQHLGLSTVSGRFNKFTGKIRENGDDLTKASVEFSAEIESVDTAIPARDNHLRTADFFDAKKWPTMTFKSSKVEKKGDGYAVTGDLTIKDKTKTISIPFKHYGPMKLEFGDMSTRIGIFADPITIKRSDFGVGSQMKLPNGAEGASDAVTVRISFEATLDK